MRAVWQQDANGRLFIQCKNDNAVAVAAHTQAAAPLNSFVGKPPQGLGRAMGCDK